MKPYLRLDVHHAERRLLTFSHLATVPSFMDGDSCGIGTRTASFSPDLSELTNLHPVERASVASGTGA